MIIPNIWEKTPTSISISISIYTWSLEDVNFRAGPCLPMKHAPTRQDTPLFGKHAPNDIDHIYEGSSFLMNSMISPLPWFFWGISNIKLPQPPALAARATYRLGQLWQLVLGWEGGVVDGDRFIQWALDRRIFFSSTWPDNHQNYCAYSPRASWSALSAAYILQIRRRSNSRTCSSILALTRLLNLAGFPIKSSCIAQLVESGETTQSAVWDSTTKRRPEWWTKCSLGIRGYLFRPSL